MKKEGEIPVTSSTVLQLLLLSYRYNRQETALPLQSTLQDNNIISSILLLFIFVLFKTFLFNSSSVHCGLPLVCMDTHLQIHMHSRHRTIIMH